MPETPLDAALELYHQIADVSNSAALLEWDQETHMPPGAAESRAHQISTLRAIAHGLGTSDELAAALANLTSYADENPQNEVAVALAREGQRDFDKATRLPVEFVQRQAVAAARAKNTWRTARENDSFAEFADDLRTVLDLAREQAELLGYREHIYDALLDLYEPGATKAQLDAVFGDLRNQLVPIVENLSPRLDDRDKLIHQHFDPAAQWKLGESLISEIGYDFSRGRQDKSAHPFCTHFSTTDVRITTRIDADFFSPGFFGTLHETGHGLYEQGVRSELERTPLASGTSLGVHESQSRLWENLIGRSRPFVEFMMPRLRAAFPEALGETDAASFHRAVNAVAPSLIRVEADEVTYNLHVMLRYELECELLEERLPVTDLPERWNAVMGEYLGIQPTSDADGVLQDIHWSMGAFGYFPTYAIGNLMASQFYDAAARDLGNLPEQVRQGEFAPLRDWLRKHIHQYGRMQTADDLLGTVTGSGLDARPWLEYIRAKYSDLYEVDL